MTNEVQKMQVLLYHMEDFERKKYPAIKAE